MLALLFAAGCTRHQAAQTTAQNEPREVAATAVAPGVQATVLPVGAQVEMGSPKPDTTTQKTVAKEETEGPFQLGDQSFTFVKRVLSIDRQPHMPDDETVDWWEIRDSTGAVVYRQSYGPHEFQNGTFAETTSVGARVLKTQFGKGLLVDGMDLPSAPNSGWWVQVFGLVNGKLVSFGPKIGTEGNFEGEAVDSFTPTLMARGGLVNRAAVQQPQKVTHDVLNFKVWTGDFSITYPVLVDWMAGKVRPAWRCVRMTTKGQVERCRYKVSVEPYRTRTDLTFVRLFTEPEEGMGTPAHVVIKPESKIEYLEAEVPIGWTEQSDWIFINSTANDGDTWLHVKIDGQDGWIHTEEDFEAVGLQESG